ncbi:MAG: GNAT family N-acetyltransferase [Acetobacteraceae bacterium]|nr:GNAT family N-acetyltransferase [Acetobacteraceae bacterium]
MDELHRGEGWRPGLIGEVATLHARHYAASHGFGPEFEAKVARELAEFTLRRHPERDFQAWVADGAGIQAHIVLDLTEPGLPDGTAHLRWFIAGPAVRGRGEGGRLLDAAIAHARLQGLRRITLWTLDRLEAAASLYARAGFTLAEEVAGTQWGTTTIERRLALDL